MVRMRRWQTFTPCEQHHDADEQRLPTAVFFQISDTERAEVTTVDSSEIKGETLASSQPAPTPPKPPAQQNVDASSITSKSKAYRWPVSRLKGLVKGGSKEGKGAIALLPPCKW